MLRAPELPLDHVLIDSEARRRAGEIPDHDVSGRLGRRRAPS